MRALKRDSHIKLSNSNRVCIDHFDKNDIIDKNGKRTLKAGAFPKYNLGFFKFGQVSNILADRAFNSVFNCNLY